MIHKKLLLLLAFTPILMSSCGDDDDLMGLWTRRTDFNGKTRGDAAFFSIGNKGYLVGGYDGKDRLSDSWEYDMATGYWTQKADFPGNARNSAAGASLDGKGYIATGYDGTNKFKDFWQFDPDANIWTQLTDFPGSARYGALAFGINGRIYVGYGYDDNYLKDMYAYNVSTGTWTEIGTLGTKRMQGSTFIINDMVYIVCGKNNGTYVDDFWKYDPSTDTWTELRKISDDSDDDYDDDYTIIRAAASVFVIDGCAYVTCGESGSIRSDTWRYYPDTDLWEDMARFGGYSNSAGSARSSAVAFSNGTRGFVAIGKSGTSYFDDMWELDPYSYDDDQ